MSLRPSGGKSVCRVLSLLEQWCGRASGMGAHGLWGGRKTGRCHHRRFLGTSRISTSTAVLRISRDVFAQMSGFSVAHLCITNVDGILNTQYSAVFIFLR